MGAKKYIKRFLNYIVHGIPQNNVKVNISQVTNQDSLSNKVGIITGGSSGIGYEIAKKSIAEGAKVIITGRNEKKLLDAAETLGNKCIPICFDMNNICELDDFVKRATSLVGDIDFLICNAGISLHEPNILSVSIENFERQMRTNLESTYFLCQSFIKYAKDTKQHNIIIITSERGFQCDDVPYGLSKAALNSLIRGLSRRFYVKGFRVNGIAPGITVSDMTKIDKEDLYCDRIASKRYFVPEEVAEVAAFLLGDATQCISGEIIACDAGEYISSYY